MRIAAYISGHGFGHLAQMAPVLNRICKVEPECSFLIRCDLPEDELKARLDFDFEYEATPVDYGVVQKSAVEEDWQKSIALMRNWIKEFDGRVDREIRLLNSFAPSLILSNISPLAFPVARALDVPGIALATLDWHTIYSYELAADDEILRCLEQAYRQCDLLLSPPMAMEMPVLPESHPVPLIASRPEPVDFSIASSSRKVALVLFGGSGRPAFDLNAIASLDEWHFLIAGTPELEADNMQWVNFDAGLRPVDLMPYADVVVCKPGYGMLSECWVSKTPVAWVERPDFPEFPMLKRWLDSQFPSSGMSRDDFRCGRWAEAMESAMRCERSFPPAGPEGEVAAADAILATVQRRKGAVVI